MDLDSLLIEVLSKSSSCSINWGFSFLLMYITGCRHEEINPIHWIEFDSQSLQLSCVKNSEVRIIQKMLLGEQLVGALLLKNDIKLVTSRSTLSRAFLYSSFPYRIMKGQSNIFLHAFRYNFIKKAFKETGDIEIVKSLIGHKDVKNTSSYVTSKIDIIRL